MPHRHRHKPPIELTPQRAAEIEQITTACREAAEHLRELSQQRTALFRQMHGEGWSVAALAKLAGISPQRMSKVLNPKVQPRDARYCTKKQRAARSAYDTWL